MDEPVGAGEAEVRGLLLAAHEIEADAGGSKARLTSYNWEL